MRAGYLSDQSNEQRQKRGKSGGRDRTGCQKLITCSISGQKRF